MQVHRIIPLSFAYAPSFLANTIKPRFYFETIYPQLVTDNCANDRATLRQYFQVAMALGVNGAPSPINWQTFLLVPRDMIVHNMHKCVLHYHHLQLSKAQA